MTVNDCVNNNVNTIIHASSTEARLFRCKYFMNRPPGRNLKRLQSCSLELARDLQLAGMPFGEAPLALCPKVSLGLPILIIARRREKFNA